MTFGNLGKFLPFGIGGVVLTQGRGWVSLGGNGAKWESVIGMWLTGSFPRTLDEKQRFAIPKPLRDALDSQEKTAFYLCPGTDESIALYSEAAFSQLAERLKQAPPTGQDVRAFSRLFFAQVQRQEADGQGRIRLPADLMALAAIRKELVLLGVGDHMEIWDPQRWEAYLAGKQPHFDDLAESAFSGRVLTAAPVAASETAESSSNARPTQSR